MQHIDRHATNYHLASTDLEPIFINVSVIYGHHVTKAICEAPPVRKLQATKGVVCETREILHVSQEVGNTYVALLCLGLVFRMTIKFAAHT